MSPDRRESPSARHIPSQRLGLAAQRLLQQVETETGFPVIVQQVPIDLHRTYAHLDYATAQRPHVISVVNDLDLIWDYLVAHECAHALRLFALPPSERRLPVVERQRERQVERFLLPQIQKQWQAVAGPNSLPLPEAPQMARLYYHGLVGQLVNFPVDLRIEAWIRESQWDLRELQEITLRTNIGELDVGLYPRVQETTPPFIYQRATALNAAYCDFVARLLDDPRLAEPHRRAGFGEIGEELTTPIWETRFADYRQDCLDSNRWAKRFGLTDWFSWQPYGL